MTTLFRTAASIAALASIAVFTPMAHADMASGQGDQEDQIRVSVDGTPVAFTGVQPIETQGAVMVPLRGVFEAMGAYVDYNPDTRLITATKGSRTVTLPLGSNEATVDGENKTLSQPARVIQGTTLVPLRFVAEALGSNVEWVSTRSLVRINTSEAPVAAAPPADDHISGVVRGVTQTADLSQITVNVDGDNKVFPVSDTTTFWRRLPGQPPVQASLSQIMRGDKVFIHQDENGVATRITANYAVRQGTVRSIGALANGHEVINLQNGSAIELTPRATIQKDGDRIALSGIQPYDRVTIHADPADNLGYGVIVGENLHAHHRN